MVCIFDEGHVVLLSPVRSAATPSTAGPFESVIGSERRAPDGAQSGQGSSLAAAFIFWARNWLALGSVTGASCANRLGKCPKKSNSVRRR